MLLALGALFSGVGSATADWLVGIVSPSAESSPPAAPTPTPTTPREELTIAVETFLGETGANFALAAPTGTDGLALRLRSGDIEKPWQAFLDSNRGAQVGFLKISLVLTGHRQPGITITNVRIEKVRDEPRLEGTHLKLYTAGEVESILLTANLDEVRPKLRDGGVDYFPEKQVELQGGEQQSLVIRVTAGRRLYRWAFAVDYVDDKGDKHTVYVDRAGRLSPSVSAIPLAELFMLTGQAPKYGASWVENLGSGFTLKRP